MKTQEIECRFLEVNKDELVKKLRLLGAEDRGEKLLEETIIYDSELKWKTDQKFLRLRKVGDEIKLTYKEHRRFTVDGTYELEFGVDDYQKAELLFEMIGLKPFRHQQKKRHSFDLEGVVFDIDTWPKIPTYVELEGQSESALKKASEAVGYSWQKAVFHDAAWIIENKYNIPVKSLHWFTFDRVE